MITILVLHVGIIEHHVPCQSYFMLPRCTITARLRARGNWGYLPAGRAVWGAFAAPGAHPVFMLLLAYSEGRPSLGSYEQKHEKEWTYRRGLREWKQSQTKNIVPKNEVLVSPEMHLQDFLIESGLASDSEFLF